MWPFKRKKTSQQPPGPRCPHCGSKHSVLIDHQGMEEPDYVKVWRGQRSLTCRCLDCGRDFYADEPPGGVTAETPRADDGIADEQALRAAEDEVRRQAREEGGKWW